MNGLKAEYADTVEFRLLNVDTDAEGQALAERFDVQYVPTFVFMDRDGSVREILVGELTEGALRSSLDALE